MTTGIATLRSPRATHRGAFAIAFAWLAVVASLGCGAPPAVSLDGTWPERVASYDEVTRAWTRQGDIRQGWDQVLQVYATFKSPAWRTAYVQRQARIARLSEDATRALLEQHKQAAAAHHELQLLVSTHESRENDLAKQPRSMWRLALVDASGRQVEAVAVERDRRPLDVIRSEFPQMGDFATAYIARFPPELAVLGQDASKFSLVISSARGSVALEWRAR